MTSHNLTIPPNTPAVQYKKHMVKCWPEFFEVMWSGVKTFEVRVNDRNYTVGDTIALHEYNPAKRFYSGRFVERRIVYITEYLQREGYIIMQLAV